MRTHLPKLLVVLLPVLSACAGGRNSFDPSRPNRAEPTFQMTFVPDLPVAHPPYDTLQASWKQRMGTPYVFMNHFGDYGETGTLIPVLLREMTAQGLEPSGPPFCLYYDDPASTPFAELRSRACIPIAGPRSPRSPLSYEMLPERTVAYAFVSGPYPDVPRAYPGIWSFLERMNWYVDGPIRHTFMVPPGENPEPDALLCEIQVPAAQRP